MKFTDQDIDLATEYYKTSLAKRERIASEAGRPDLAAPYAKLSRKLVHTLLKRTSDLNPSLTKEQVMFRAGAQGVWGAFTENVSRKWAESLQARGTYVSYTDLMLGNPEVLAKIGFKSDMQIRDDSEAAEILNERYQQLKQQGLRGAEINRIISLEFFGSP